MNTETEQKFSRLQMIKTSYLKYHKQKQEQFRQKFGWLMHKQEISLF